jgi:3-phosphoshikimate 1-carboxyvinyltransferase
MNYSVVKRSFSSIKKIINNIPGDKSVSHRAIIIGSISENNSIFENFLTADDCLNTVSIFQDLGVCIKVDGTRVEVFGVGLNGLKPFDGVLDVGNSGTGIRLITGLLAGQSFESKITGDSSIQKRPMMRVVVPLTEMGADISGLSGKKEGEVYPPLTIRPVGDLKAIEYKLPVASAQVKSCVLFASLFNNEKTVVIEPKKCRDHTEKMLAKFGADITVDGSMVCCSGKNKLKNPGDEAIYIPADISSAAFFIVLVCVLKGAEVCFSKIGLNSTRAAIIDVLKEMGADIEIKNIIDAKYEPYGDIVVRSSDMKNINVSEGVIPFIIDEIPVLAIAGLFSQGKMIVRNAKELRVKESDRIVAIVEMVKAFGGNIVEYEDGFELEGCSVFKNFKLNSFGDHRIAMSAIVGAYAAGVEAEIESCDCINTSFPSFFNILDSVVD